MTDKPTDEALENLFVEETGFDVDDFPAAIFDFARAVLAKWGQPAQAEEPVARLEIESLKAQLHAAKQINAAQFGLLAASIPGSALRASHGQASSQAGEYPALVCDYCGALTPDPWHSSGMLHGKMSKHIHSCDACAARGAAQAQDTREPLTPERVKEIVRGAGYDQCGIPDTERSAFINGLRHGEREHGIKGGQHGTE